jgi:hypothetical protein
LEKASSGIVKVKPVVTVGKTNSSGKSPVPVALWIAGPDKKAGSTEVLSFTIDSPDQLRHEVLEKVFSLIQSNLSRTTAYTPPTELAEAEDPLIALSSRVTRLCWNEFAAAMNEPQKAPQKP